MRFEDMNMKVHLVGALAVLSVLALAGCGACGQVSQSRSEFLSQQTVESADRGHHIIIDMSKTLVTEQAKTSFSAARKTNLKLRKMGDVGRLLDDISVSPKSIAVDFDMRNAAKVTLDLDVAYGRHTVFGIELDAVAPIEYDPKTKTLSMIIRYDIFRKVKPKLSNGAADRLTDRLHRQLPTSARALFPKSQLSRYTDKGIRHLVANLYPSIREDILKPMGEITRFSFKMPDVPIERIALVSTKSNVRLGIRTTLAATGLREKNPRLKKNEMRFAISSDALAKLGNWAMSEGKMPDRYNRKGKATSSGEFVAGLDWKKESSPMKVKLWTAQVDSSPMCLFVQAGAVPVVSLKNKTLKVGFKDGKIEDVIGPPLIEEAMDLMGIGKRAIGYTKSVALKQNIRIGSRRMGVAITRAGFSNQALRLNMRVGPKTSKSRQKKSTKGKNRG